jgi:hypothetical protein
VFGFPPKMRSRTRRRWYEDGTFSASQGLGDGASEDAFDDLYGTEEKCRAAIFAWRWPDGFVCPGCGGRSYSLIRTRALYQCSTCLRQTSLNPAPGSFSSSPDLIRLDRAIHYAAPASGSGGR